MQHATCRGFGQPALLLCDHTKWWCTWAKTNTRRQGVATTESESCPYSNAKFSSFRAFFACGKIHQQEQMKRECDAIASPALPKSQASSTQTLLIVGVQTPSTLRARFLPDMISCTTSGTSRSVIAIWLPLIDTLSKFRMLSKFRKCEALGKSTAVAPFFVFAFSG